VNEVLFDAMLPLLRDRFGHKPHTHSKQASQQVLGLAKKKKPRINKIRKAIKQQLGHLKLNLLSIEALIACGGFLLAAGRHIYQNLAGDQRASPTAGHSQSRRQQMHP
jgi:hypothetical protein